VTFVDTSALYALLVRDDPNHGAASGALGGLRERGPLVTHSYVVVETAALVQHRFGVSAVRSLVDLLGPIEIVYGNADMIDAGSPDHSLLLSGSDFNLISSP